MTIKTVLITGASSGIGYASAELFFQRGWNVVATMRNPDSARSDKRWLATKLDVTSAATIQPAIDATVSRFGKIDVLVNNAGYGLSGSFESTDELQIERQFQTNVFGLMRVCRAVLPQMRVQGGGHIVNVASMGGRLCFPFYSIYHASKWAVEGFSESLQFEVEPLNIRVKIIEPGAIRTDFYQRSADFAHDRRLDAYNALVDKVIPRMKQVGAKGSEPRLVAEAIFRAATDASLRLRYPVGPDAEMLLRVRRWLGDMATYKAIKGRLLK